MVGLQHAGADPGFLNGGGSRLGLPAKKGGLDGGPILGPMLKSLYIVAQKGGS